MASSVITVQNHSESGKNYLWIQCTYKWFNIYKSHGCIKVFKYCIVTIDKLTVVFLDHLVTLLVCNLLKVGG